MSQKLLIYDEYETGKNLYEGGFADNLSWDDKLAVAKYIRYKYECGDAKTKTLMNTFLKKGKFYVEVPFMKSMRDLIRNSKREFITADSILITEKELNFIRSHKNFRWQLVMLGLLFIAKRKKNRGYVNIRDWKDVRLISSVRSSSNEIFDILYSLDKENNAVRVTQQKSHEILFIDSNLNSSVIFKISSDKDAKMLSSLYKKWCGGELAWCKECGKEFVKTKKELKYCEDHRGNIMKNKRYDKKRNFV